MQPPRPHQSSCRRVWGRDDFSNAPGIICATDPPLETQSFRNFLLLYTGMSGFLPTSQLHLQWGEEPASFVAVPVAVSVNPPFITISQAPLLP